MDTPRVDRTEMYGNAVIPQTGRIDNLHGESGVNVGGVKADNGFDASTGESSCGEVLCTQGVMFALGGTRGWEGMPSVGIDG